jgi:hypothetical protein
VSDVDRRRVAATECFLFKHDCGSMRFSPAWTTELKRRDSLLPSKKMLVSGKRGNSLLFYFGNI